MTAAERTVPRPPAAGRSRSCSQNRTCLARRQAVPPLPRQIPGPQDLPHSRFHLIGETPAATAAAGRAGQQIRRDAVARPPPADRHVDLASRHDQLRRGILAVFNQAIWDQDGFAVASGYDESSGQYLGLRIPNEDLPPQISDTTLLVHPDRAIAQRERERAEQEAARAAAAAAAAAAAGTGTAGTASGGTSTGAGTGAGPSGGVPVPGGGSMPGPLSPHGSTPPAGPGPAAPPARRNTRFFGTVRLDPERYGRDINRLYQEVIQHLAAPEGVDLEITVEITASKKDGFPDDKTRIVSENARTLKFDQFGFEDH